MDKYRHGGDIYSRKIKYDFSANINPLGIPENIKKSLTDSIDSFQNYPDTECRKLVKKISETEDIEQNKIVCGNGVSDLIYRIVAKFQPKKALLTAPTFSEYEKALRQSGAEIKYFLTDELTGFKPDMKILDYLTDDTDIFFICNPNNPTGNTIDRKLMEKIIERCSLKNIFLVVDESFIDFMADSGKHSIKKLADGKNIIVLRAFTKIYAIAGLRLGYAICGTREISEAIKNYGQCWSVSVPAQIAGISALENTDYIARTIETVSAERKFLTENLDSLGFGVFHSQVNFILIKSDLPLDKLLEQREIAIRNCENYIGLGQGYFRLAVRTRTENEALIKAIAEICGKP